MSLVIYEAGAICIVARFVQRKGKTYYFRRRIPDDVASHYPNRKGVIFFSLKTQDANVAARKADEEARRQDALWNGLRSGDIEHGPEVDQAAVALLEAFGVNPGGAVIYKRAGLEPTEFYNYLTKQGNMVTGSDEHEAASRGEIEKALGPDDDRATLRPHERMALDLFRGNRGRVMRFSEAVRFFQDECGETGRAYTSRQAATRRLIEILGDLPVSSFTRENARTFRDHLIEQGLKTHSVRRNLNYISPVINHALREMDLEGKNPFERLAIPNKGKDEKHREPLSVPEIDKIQRASFRMDDEIRHLVAMVSDTGCRLSEVAGLHMDDIRLNSEVPHIIVRPNRFRGLKEAVSERHISLVGMALWGAKRRVMARSGGAAFPKYVSEDAAKSKLTNASNTVAKWIRSQGIDKTAHSFRHSMRDRLREVGAPEEVHDQIGGWASKSVGRSYGGGYSLTALKGWMDRIVILSV